MNQDLSPEAQLLLKEGEGLLSSLSPSYIFLSILFSLIGFGYWRYGKRMDIPVVKYIGIVLMIYPYFVTNSWALSGIGIVLCAVPFLLRFR